jgi:hypothetical protein
VEIWVMMVLLVLALVAMPVFKLKYNAEAEYYEDVST